MSREIKEDTGAGYGADVAKNQELFDREMSAVVDRVGFKKLYKRLSDANLLGINEIGMRMGGVHFSKSQSAKIISLSRDYLSGSVGKMDLERFSIEMAVLDMIKLGGEYVSLSDEDLEFCLYHHNSRLRHQTCWRFDLNAHQIDGVIDFYTNRKNTVVSMPGIVIDRYAKSFNAAQIEKIQLTGNMEACCSMWFIGVGDSPIEKTPGMDKDDFLRSFSEEKFLNWRSDYISRLESEKFKRLSFVSDLVQSNGIKSIHKAVL